MFRRGKTQGWLELPTSSLRDWAAINNVELNGVDFGPIPGFDERGSAVKASRSRDSSSQEPLIVVPRELILSCESVQVFAKSDRHLREVLEAVGDFGRTARGAILIFLLVQATHSCPDLPETIGASSALTDYIKYLPLEDLPTFWSEEDLEVLAGTSLAAALDAKFNSLYQEYENLRKSTAHITWCKNCWWDEVDGILTFDDWKQVDAMYRSRALEFPGIGDAMVPCVDMANHASGRSTVALYESDDSGNGLLLVRPNHDLSENEEITITYGDEKGACEMLFSYGFVEDGVESARDILLGLKIPDDDPLGRAKRAVAVDAPGVRLYDTAEGLKWESEYIWLICVNEEDGLQIALVQTVDGEQELVAKWKEQGISRTRKLKPLLQSDELWEVFELRAVSIIQGRVEEQLRELMKTEETLEGQRAGVTEVQSRRRDLATKLRTLEFDLLERFYEFFENEKTRLIECETVKHYLANQDGASATTDEDFS